jgi:hypothetical protein
VHCGVYIIIYLILCTPLTVGGSSNNSSHSVDISVVYTISIAALRCFLGSVYYLAVGGLTDTDIEHAASVRAGVTFPRPEIHKTLFTSEISSSHDSKQ